MGVYLILRYGLIFFFLCLVDGIDTMLPGLTIYMHRGERICGGILANVTNKWRVDMNDEPRVVLSKSRGLFSYNSVTETCKWSSEYRVLIRGRVPSVNV
ncbi:hypothetical protein Tco_0444895 [Tanacetum coccineum]